MRQCILYFIFQINEELLSWKWSTGHYLHYPSRAIKYMMQPLGGWGGLIKYIKTTFFRVANGHVKLEIKSWIDKTTILIKDINLTPLSKFSKSHYWCPAAFSTQFSVLLYNRIKDSFQTVIFAPVQFVILLYAVNVYSPLTTLSFTDSDTSDSWTPLHVC